MAELFETDSVGAFPRNAQGQRSSRNCAHAEGGAEGQRSSRNCAHEAGLEVGAFPRNALPLPPAPGFFSPNGNIRTWRGNLPHWQQAGVATFVTLRAEGSLPRERLDELRAFDEEWRNGCASPSNEELQDYVRRRRAMVEKWLDAGDGSCPFSTEEARQAVEKVLRTDDGRRYRLYTFVIMPNHVHVLFLPVDAFWERDLATIKRFSAVGVNRANGTNGTVWQREHYDTLIRDAAHFRRVRDYIWNNCPARAWDVYREAEFGGAFRGNASTEKVGAVL